MQDQKRVEFSAGDVISEQKKETFKAVRYCKNDLVYPGSPNYNSSQLMDAIAEQLKAVKSTIEPVVLENISYKNISLPHGWSRIFTTKIYSPLEMIWIWTTICTASPGVTPTNTTRISKSRLRPLSRTYWPTWTNTVWFRYAVAYRAASYLSSRLRVISLNNVFIFFN